MLDSTSRAPLPNLSSPRCSEVRIVDKITDLPVNYSKYLTNRRPQTSQSRSASYGNVPEQYQAVPQQQFSQTEPAQQYRTTTYNYPGMSLRDHRTRCAYRCSARCVHDYLPLVVHEPERSRRKQRQPIGRLLEICLSSAEQTYFHCHNKRDMRIS